MPGGASTAPLWQAPAVTGALIALAGSLVVVAINGVRARRDRRRDVYAQALASVAEYWEYPYVVRRRRHDDLAGERVRISEQLRAVQQDLSRHQAWMETEDTAVANAYARLVEVTRSVVGPQISEGWRTPPITSDEQMNISDVTRKGMADAVASFLQAVKDHLALIPAPVRRGVRSGWKRVRRGRSRD